MLYREKVLICDDDKAIHDSIAAYLDLENMEHLSVFDGSDVVNLIKNTGVTFVILEIVLPVKNGIELCKEIRSFSEVPILFLTGRTEEMDRVLGLELGADDYVTKPFSPREVIARIKTILRRARTNHAPNRKEIMKYRNLSIDKEAYEVSLDGEKIKLTPKEVEILCFLAENNGKVVRREQLLNHVWGYEYYGDVRVVDAQIKRLRKKLLEKEVCFAIRTVYGIGYKFELGQ